MTIHPLSRALQVFAYLVSRQHYPPQIYAINQNDVLDVFDVFPLVALGQKISLDVLPDVF